MNAWAAGLYKHTVIHSQKCKNIYRNLDYDVDQWETRKLIAEKEENLF